MQKKEKESLWEKIMYMDTFYAALICALILFGVFVLFKEVLLA